MVVDRVEEDGSGGQAPHPTTPMTLQPCRAEGVNRRPDMQGPLPMADICCGIGTVSLAALDMSRAAAQQERRIDVRPLPPPPLPKTKEPLHPRFASFFL